MGKNFFRLLLAALLLNTSGCIGPVWFNEDADKANVEVPPRQLDAEHLSDSDRAYCSCVHHQAKGLQPDDQAYSGCRRVLATSKCVGKACDGLMPAEISCAIGFQLTPVRQCYERELQSAAQAKGRMELGFSIVGDGKTKGVQIDQHDFSPAMTDCIKAQVAAWVFPKPLAGKVVPVRYPLVFNPI